MYDDGNPIDKLLSRLNFRRTGDNRWMAHCPAHRDKDASLAIKETLNGTVLVKCFSGCETVDVLDAIGLTFKDLYPGEFSEPAKRPTQEITDRWIVRLGANKLKAGALSEEDTNTMYAAMERLDRGHYGKD